jgi:hypothetical protein
VRELKHRWGWPWCCFWSRILTGAWIETSVRMLGYVKLWVASLRVRELKRVSKISFCFLSHPYGCVNWNTPSDFLTATTNGRILTGAWIETPWRNGRYRFASSHPYRCVNWNPETRIPKSLEPVASLRVWIETRHWRLLSKPFCRILTGAWIETLIMSLSHPYGCVNWNSKGDWQRRKRWPVASLRVRELKHKCKRLSRRILKGAWIETHVSTEDWWWCIQRSHPYGCVNWNIEVVCLKESWIGRILTGAWIETERHLCNSRRFRRILTGAWIETNDYNVRGLLWLN